jgi:hypothetical protein
VAVAVAQKIFAVVVVVVLVDFVQLFKEQAVVVGLKLH